MTLITAILATIACSGEKPADPMNTELEAHRQWLASCQDQTANFEACRTYCAQVPDPQERSDCFFQLAEAAPRWSNGDARLALQVIYTVCNYNQDFASQCFRHALHELALTCNARGESFAAEPNFYAGERWARWQGCVAGLVLQRQGKTCLPAQRDTYHNMWTADDAPLCGQ